MLKERNAVVVKWLDEEEDDFKGKPSTQDFARISKRLVQEESDRVFNDFVAVVSIRYRELDRVSEYGIVALSPEDRERIINSAPGPASETTQWLAGPDLPLAFSLAPPLYRRWQTGHDLWHVKPCFL
jgi:hypothetical protein